MKETDIETMDVTDLLKDVDLAPDIDAVRVLDEDKIEVADCNEDKE